MKILLFGATGQLGTECRKNLYRSGWELISVGRQDADFLEPAQVAAAIERRRPDVVVNACAYTAVDQAEKETRIATRINAESVGVMAAKCAELGIPTIHISTDYVFSGLSRRPYREHHKVSPLNVYGMSKLYGEQVLQQENPRHILLRTSWVFSSVGDNFLTTMLRLANERTELSIVGDQIGCPTYAADIAVTIAQFIQRYERDGDLPWGLYHCAGAESCSWFEFAQAIFMEGMSTGILEKAPRLTAIRAEDYPSEALRPGYSVLDSKKLADFLGYPVPGWQRGVELACRQLAKETIAQPVS